MDLSENDPRLSKPTNPKEIVRRNTRRALSSISQNLVGVPLVNKRVLQKRDVVCGDGFIKNEVIHRPITRQYAAQIATSNHLPKKPDSSSSFTVWEDFPFSKIDEKSVPMTMELEQQETTMAEDQIDNNSMEIEMEDIFDETILDIDSLDAKNHLAVSDYVSELHTYYRKMEKTVAHDYLAIQFEINDRMRAILVDWLIEVHHKFELREETLFLTINLIDRFLSKKSILRKKLQLVGLVALLLACKYEEVSVPVVDDLMYISDKSYSRKEILEMEKLMLNTLQFNMSLPTPYVFIRRFLKAAESDKKLEVMSLFLIELCLVEYEMVKFPPSFLAAAAIYTAQCTLYGVKQWNKTCEWHSSYSEDQLLECSKLIVGFHQKAAIGRLTGVFRKYSMSNFGFAAKSEPALFLIMEKKKNQS